MEDKTGGAASVAGYGVLTACGDNPPAAPAAAAAAYVPGTYTASAHGMESDVVVTMTFSEDAITDVKIDVSSETPGIGAAAGDTLVEQIMNAQGAEIEIDAIVNAQDMLPNTELAEGIDGEVYCIGDCAAPFNIALAIRAGNDTGRAL